MPARDQTKLPGEGYDNNFSVHAPKRKVRSTQTLSEVITQTRKDLVLQEHTEDMAWCGVIALLGARRSMLPIASRRWVTGHLCQRASGPRSTLASARSNLSSRSVRR